MKTMLEKRLIEQEGYTKKAANITAIDLLNITDEEIKNAVLQWCLNGYTVDITKNSFSVKTLMEKHELKYPAALIFFDWYIDSPNEALNSIKY